MSEDNNNLPLSELQLKAIEWIKRKSLNKGCEVCGQNHWIVPTEVVAPINMKDGFLQIGGGNSYAHFLSICGNCGNTKFFNAVISGIIEPTKKGGEQDGK